MPSEVGSGQVAIFPTFKGFRKAVDAEVDGSAKSASTRFATGFRSAGSTAGRGFSDSFKAATSDVTAAPIRQATAEVAKASRDLATVRLREQNATGQVRVAEAQLTDARARHGAESVQVIRAEERLATAQRTVAAAEQNTAGATARLAAAKRDLAVAANSATNAVQRGYGTFAQLPGVLGGAGASSARRFGSVFLDVLGGALGANILTGVGFAIGRGINRGITSALEYGFTGVQLASDLEQSLGAVEQVFKQHAGNIEDIAKEADYRVGLSQANYLQFATLVGAQLKNLRIPFDEVASQTDDLIVLGADLAAQFGGKTSDAVAALSSLLRGERDPIERYGVSIKQSDINARLAAEGLKGLTGEALRQAEIQATLAILYKQTADAQGTFYREADTYAHQQQVLNAQLEEAQTKFGQYLLPAFTSATEFANERLLPALGEVIDKVGPKFEEALHKAGPAAEQLLDKLVPLSIEFGEWAADDGIPAVLDILDQMADAAPGWASAWDWANDPNAQPMRFLNDLMNSGKALTGGKGLVNIIGEWLGGKGQDFNQFLTDYGWDTGAAVGAGAKAGLGASHPFDFNSFGTNGVPSSDFNSFGLDAGREVADGASAAVQQAGPFDFDSFGIEQSKEMGAFKQLGLNYGQSVADGIKGKQGIVGLAALGLATEAKRQLKAGFQIASPSKAGIADGANYGSAVAFGIESQAPAVRRGSDALTSAARFSGPAVSSSSTSAGVSERPIYADGLGLIGVMREVAGGEARIVFDREWAVKRDEGLAGGSV